MSSIRQLLVFLTGHRLSSNTPAGEVGSLTKIGAAIAFASILAAIQFGIAGWFLAMNLYWPLQLMMALVCASIGALIVLVLDRNFIYLADTRYESEKNIAYIYLGIRIFLITVIGSLSSQFTMPLLLKSELAIHSQDLKDGRYTQAKERYHDKYDVPEKVKGVEQLDTQIVRLKKELQVMPPDLVRKRNAYDQCFATYRQKLRTTFAPDLDESEIVNLYAKDKRECERLESIFRESYRAYTEPREEELAKASEGIVSAKLAVEGAKQAVATDLAKTSANNEAYINVASSDVLWSLIQHHPGALMKYVLLSLLQLCLELMPILLKIQAGQSQMGHRIALAAYERKTANLAQMNVSAGARIESDLALQRNRHEQAMIARHQQSQQQDFDLRMASEKIAKDLANEQLRQELVQLKRQNTATAWLQDKVSYTFKQAFGGHGSNSNFGNYGNSAKPAEQTSFGATPNYSFTRTSS